MAGETPALVAAQKTWDQFQSSIDGPSLAQALNELDTNSPDAARFSEIQFLRLLDIYLPDEEWASSSAITQALKVRTLAEQAAAPSDARVAHWLEPLMQEGRARPNVRLVPADVSGVRAVLAALKRGEAAGFLPDQVPGEGEGEWADFFGRRAYTMTLAARLAGRDGVLCFLAYAKRLPRGAGYAIAIRPYPEAHPQENPVRRLNRALEALVRECPEQYLWGYNRYKTPRGARPQ